MNKNKPVSIPGFKNSSQIHSRMQFEHVHVGNGDSNKLIPRSAAEELTQEDIIQILREKKAKKELAKLQKDRVDSNLRERKVQEDMIGFAQDKKHRLEPEQKPD